MKLKLLLVALLAAGSVYAAETAPLQMKGVLNTGSERLFGLSTQAGAHSAWVSLGKTFDGYALKSYDDGKGLLILEREGKTYELTLATAKITSADAAKGTPATIADANAVIDKMRFEQMIARMMEGQKKTMVKAAQQLAKQAGANADPKDIEEQQTKVMDAMIEAMNIPQLKQDMAQIYADTFSKEELTALNDFYSTPAGEALIDKQPQVQEKLQAAVLPRMMAAMPKIQQLSAEFLKQQQGKAQAASAATPAATATTTTATK